MSKSAVSDPLFDLATLGETMLRLSVPPGDALETSSTADLHAAGAESNVACALASLGRRVAWASRLPDNPPGRLIANAIRATGVDLSLVEWCDAGRVGTFFVELEAPPAPVRVTYDRAGSCATLMSADSIDWDKLLSTRLLHLTGITPALSASCRDVIEQAIARARDARVPISFDINYRAKLWNAADAKDVLSPLVRGADLLFIGQSDAETVFGITGSPEQQLTRLADLTQAKRIVLTIGGEGLLAWDNGTTHDQPALPTVILDRLGAGDALAAGVIHGWLDNDFPLGLRAGAALASLALRRRGDILCCHKSELADLLSATNDRPRR